LNLDPNDPAQVQYTPILTPWPKHHLGPAGFVLDRVVRVSPAHRSDLTDLVPLARLTKLQGLSLYRTGVTDLTPLRGLKSLRELTIPEGTVTQALVDALARDLPDCPIARQ
jgi:hypothetical protein